MDEVELVAWSWEHAPLMVLVYLVTAMRRLRSDVTALGAEVHGLTKAVHDSQPPPPPPSAVDAAESNEESEAA